MLASLTLEEFKDRDLLYILEESADIEGWATAQEMAERIGIEHPRPAQCVGSRLAWLKRYKVPLETKEAEGTTFWRIPDNAKSLIRPKPLSAAAQRAIDSLDEGQRVAVTETIAAQASRASSVPATHLARRAWNHSMLSWRDPSLARRQGQKKTASKK